MTIFLWRCLSRSIDTYTVHSLAVKISDLKEFKLKLIRTGLFVAVLAEIRDILKISQYLDDLSFYHTGRILFLRNSKAFAEFRAQ